MFFSAFSSDYGFIHITSGPWFPQSNGEVECAVKTVKALLKKCEGRKGDYYVALMAYWVTPLECVYSSAELLMSCMLRTNVPMSYKQIWLKVLDPSTLLEKE